VTTLAFSRGWSRTAADTNPILFVAIVVWRRVRRQMRIRNDRRVLQSMPDHMLADIGIGRGEIPYATTFGRDPAHGLTDRR
jgi:uncharacterized protein YjiS (DUF1127 family)